jgi:3-hydroxymyristoyl/3-hydroxydecanoyl-(acyl carrier protein) dehydratase
VTPRNRELTYELFVSELHAGPEPTVYADVVCTVDGVKAVHISRLGLRLVPDWPLTYWGMLGPPRFLSADDGMPSDVGADTRARVPLRELGGSLGHLDPRPVANSDGHAFGYRAMLATAWGHYTEAFGGLYKSLDDHRAVSRLPGPPYLMMSRATCIEGSLGRPEIGNAVTAEYDVSEQHWYWDRNREAAMPIAVLLEILLQPCGWLTCHAGFPLSSAQVLRFRNLDGTGIVTGDVLPGAAVMTTRATLRSMARNQDIIILGFDVSCRHGDREVFTGAMTFGYFPARALEQAGGVPTTEQERHCLHQPCDLDVDLSTRPRRFFAEPPGLPGPMLLMLDRITGFWPDGGIAGLGRLRAVKDVDAGDWYFKAHFFQDPVCPGSLGLQAMYQLLAYYMIDRGMHEGVPGARFAVAHPANTLSWTYRGQVTPATTRFTIDLHLTEVSQDTVGGHAVADAWLWADGVRIYEVRGLRLRIVSAPRETQR